MQSGQTIDNQNRRNLIGDVTRLLPFTLLFLAMQVCANAWAGTLQGVLPVEALVRWGVSAHTIVAGEYYRLLTGLFLSQDLGMFLRQLLFVALVIGLFEARFGTRIAIVTYFAISIPGTLLSLAVVAGPLNPLFAHMDTAVIHDVGMSAGGFGLLAILMAESRHHRLWIALTLMALVAKCFVALHLIPDTIHLITFAMGWYCYRSVQAQGRNPAGQRA